MPALAPNGPSTTSTPTLTTLTARRLHQIATSDLPTALYEKASLCIIDFLGAVHTGLQLPWKDALVKYVQLQGRKPEAYAWGVGRDVAVQGAAFGNAVLAHSAIRDDMHLESCSHIGSIVISAALALAQRGDWSGEKLLRAVIGGYEAAAVLGTAIRRGGTFNPHFRPSGLIGAFGAAAVAVVGEHVDDKIAVNALGYAVNMAAGVNEWAWSGGMEIFIQMGVASRSGIASFDLAKAGFECSDTALEGKDGFFNALNVGTQAANDFREWLESSPVGKGISDVRFKPVAGCNFAQTTSAVAVRIHQKHKVGEIKRIKITATSQAVKYPGCDNAGPLHTIQNTKMSIHFGVCGALLYGKLDEDIFKRAADKNVNELMAKCQLNPSTEFDEAFERGLQSAAVEVTLADGAIIRESADDVPWLTEDEVEARAISEQSRNMSNEAATKIVNTCKRLKELGRFGELAAAWKP